jgi:hypothetical protein
MSETFLLKISEQLLEENKKLKGTQAAKYNQGLKAGISKERERIVSLLINVAVDQDALLELNPTNEQSAIIETVIATTYQLMELIKGEQND